MISPRECLSGPQETLYFTLRILQERYNFNILLLDELQDPDVSLQKKGEIIASAIGSTNKIDPDDIAQIVTSISGDVAFYGHLLEISLLKGHEKAEALPTQRYLDQLKEILTKPPSQPVSEDEYITFALLYQQVWLHLQQELDARRENKKLGITREDYQILDQSGYFEVPFLQDLMKLLLQELGPDFKRTADHFKRVQFKTEREMIDQIKRDLPRTWKPENFRALFQLDRPWGEKAWTFESGFPSLRISVAERINLIEAFYERNKKAISSTELGSKLNQDQTQILQFITDDLPKWRELNRFIDELWSKLGDLKNELSFEERLTIHTFLKGQLPAIGSPYLYLLESKLEALETSKQKIKAALKSKPKQTAREAPECGSSSESTDLVAPAAVELAKTIGQIAESLAPPGESAPERAPAPPSVPSAQPPREGSPVGFTEEDELPQSSLIAELEIFKKGLQKTQSKTTSAVPPSSSPEDSNLAELRKKFTGTQRRNQLLTLFDDSGSNPGLSFNEIRALVIAVGGQISQDGTSHCRVTLPGGFSFASRPHGKAREEKITGKRLKSFRTAFEMGGITPEKLGLL